MVIFHSCGENHVKKSEKQKTPGEVQFQTSPENSPENSELLDTLGRVDQAIRGRVQQGGESGLGGTGPLGQDGQATFKKPQKGLLILPSGYRMGPP